MGEKSLEGAIIVFFQILNTSLRNIFVLVELIVH